ncbi:hypothetical protein KAT95_02375 [Candidatus Parcubacteria bacterium]|nr:hypothetical protein [Candidatus Parcubacteria bacterium]
MDKKGYLVDIYKLPVGTEIEDIDIVFIPTKKMITDKGMIKELRPDHTGSFHFQSATVEVNNGNRQLTNNGKVLIDTGNEYISSFTYHLKK